MSRLGRCNPKGRKRVINFVGSVVDFTTALDAVDNIKLYL
jgi:hypothetical protein